MYAPPPSSRPYLRSIHRSSKPRLLTLSLIFCPFSAAPPRRSPPRRSPPGRRSSPRRSPPRRGGGRSRSRSPVRRGRGRSRYVDSKYGVLVVIDQVGVSIGPTTPDACETAGIWNSTHVYTVSLSFSSSSSGSRSSSSSSSSSR